MPAPAFLQPEAEDVKNEREFAMFSTPMTQWRSTCFSVGMVLDVKRHEAEPRTHHVEKVPHHLRVVQHGAHLLVDGARRLLLPLGEPGARGAQRLRLVLVEQGELVHGEVDLAQFLLREGQLAHDVPVGEPDRDHLLEPARRAQDRLLDPAQLAAERAAARGPLLDDAAARNRAGRAGAALQVEEELARAAQLVVVGAEELRVARHVLVELDVLEEVLQIVALGHLVRGDLHPHLPVGPVEALHLERDGDAVGGVGVGDDGAQRVRQRAEAAALEVRLLHGEGVGGRRAELGGRRVSVGVVGRGRRGEAEGGDALKDGQLARLPPVFAGRGEDGERWYIASGRRYRCESLKGIVFLVRRLCTCFNLRASELGRHGHVAVARR